MSFRSATVFVDPSAASDKRLETAIALASTANAHLDAVALLVEPSFNYVAGAEIAIETWSQQVSELRGQAAEIAKAAQSKIAAAGLGGGARGDTAILGGLSEMAALHARYCDIAIVGQPADDETEGLTQEVLDGVLFSSGRPALVVPTGGAADADFGRIVIAWDGGKPATRAVNDALPFLTAAKAVSLTLIDPRPATGRVGEEPGAEIARQLAHHDVKVEIDRLPAMGKSVAEALLEHARDTGAGMIVMGGYGHSKLREALIGGVTRDMLRSAGVPILMSH